MTLYVVIWRSHDTTERKLTNVYLLNNQDPYALSDDLWADLACEIEEESLEKDEKSQPPSVMGYDLIAVLRGPITLIR